VDFLASLSNHLLILISVSVFFSTQSGISRFYARFNPITGSFLSIVVLHAAFSVIFIFPFLFDNLFTDLLGYMYFIALTSEPLILLLVEITIKILLCLFSRPLPFFFFRMLFTLLFSCSLSCYLSHFDLDNFHMYIDLMQCFLDLLLAFFIITLMEVFDCIVFLGFVHSGC
jgi:hypothetical protein